MNKKYITLGEKFPKSYNVWSDKNNTSPTDYTSTSHDKVWWKCEYNEHDDFYRTILSSSSHDFRCPKCSKIHGAKKRMVNIKGLKQGELTVLEYDEETSLLKKSTYWKCHCSCGDIKSMPYDSIKNGALTCGNKTKHYTGEKSANWKGGVSSDYQKARTSLDYDNWRDSVYAKDWYTCQCCGKSHGINKQAHHLKNFATNEDIRFDVKNGITLCDSCHYSTFPGSFHNTYGTANNTSKQLEEYINNKRKELGIDIPFTIESYLNGNILKPNTDLDIYKTT